MMIQTIKPVLKKTKVYDVYWKFAYERQNIFIKKFKGATENFTDDPILMKYKFTNTYRASDRVSQYLIRNVIYRESFSPEDTVFRILLFKTFNNIETWEYLQQRLSRICYKDFSARKYGSILSERYDRGEKIYSGAYIMPSGKTAFGFERKFMNHLSLIDFMMRDGITDKILECKTLEDVYNTLLIYPMIGKFLAYQYAIDINYSELVDFDEMEFIIAGPGAKEGIRKCFSNYHEYSEDYIIRYMCEQQENEFKRLNLDFISLWGRRLQLIDCQNIFCETDKYSREKYPDIVGANGRTRIKQKYVPRSDKIDYFYPPKWEINDKIIGSII